VAGAAAGGPRNKLLGSDTLQSEGGALCSSSPTFSIGFEESCGGALLNPSTTLELSRLLRIFFFFDGGGGTTGPLKASSIEQKTLLMAPYWWQSSFNLSANNND
jgi:hypothetical protein